jgi:hypothetical protein
MHLETNARVAGIAAPVVSGPDYETRAAESVRAELADMSGADSNRLPVAAARQSRPRVRSDVRPAQRRAVRPARATEEEHAARQRIVSDLLTTNPDATTRHALSALTEAGHKVTDRTARRLLSEARSTDTTPDTVTDHAPDTATMLAMVEA